MRGFTAFLIGLFLSQGAIAETTSAPSFDCSKTSYPIENVICSDAELSVLDSDLSKKFAEVKKEHPHNGTFLLHDQRKWLKRRLQCSPHGKDEPPTEERKQFYVDCLSRLYKERIKVLSYPEFWPPFSELNVNKAIERLRTMDPQDLYDIMTDENREMLSELSCRFFEADPAAASQTFAVFFGSSMDGWNPLCRKIDIADRVPQVETLFTALKPINGASTACDGTLRFSYGRQEKILRILAAVDPNPVKNGQEIRPLDTAELGYTPDLKHWSQQGNWEKRQYDALQPILQQANVALSNYYQNTFHVTEEQANSAAKFYTTRIIREQAENTGRSQTPGYMSLCFDNSDLDTYLATSKIPDKTFPYGQFVDMSNEATLRRFLGLAIVNQYPIETIQKLIADGAELNQKRKEFNYHRVVNDSPLMLAAPYSEITDLLLKAGANVNEQNAFGKTALMYAIQERNGQSVSLLLNANADTNLTTSENVQCTALKAGRRTALMYAAWQSTSAIIKMLINAKADITAKDTNNEMALAYLARNEMLSSEEKRELEKLLAPTP
jgi:uncharacterized protein YecT (DUF1311 family)